MKQKLPYSDFKWISEEEYKIAQAVEDPSRGYFLEVDLEYTDDCKKKTYKFPLAPEKKVVDVKDLNKWQKDYLEDRSPKIPKLICDLKDKKNYVIHSRLLNYYQKLGLEVTKIHRIISFREEDWLAPYIDFNTDMRTKAKTEFEKAIWKLLNNAFYGKTCEKIRNRVDVEIVNTK